MCCFFVILLFLGPRFAIPIWWLLQPARWNAAFQSFIWPLLGFIFLPWTTLMFVAVAPFGNVAGSDWLWLALAFFGDLMSFGFGGRARRVYA
jgi:hypothetical protein